MNETLLAYSAGVIDSDGWITIKRRKSQAKSGDVYTYAAAIGVGQVQPDALALMANLFGGNLRLTPPSIPGGRDMFRWSLERNLAVACAKLLMPFLRIKRRQAEILLEFDVIMKNPRFRTAAHWYELDESEPMYTAAEAATVKGIKIDIVYQCISNRTVPVVRKKKRGSCGHPGVHIPKRFWDNYAIRRGGPKLPPEYIALREKFRYEIRNLNGPTSGYKAKAEKPGR